jgi:hypothetical protein
MSFRRFPIASALLVAALSACTDEGGSGASYASNGGPFGDRFEAMDADAGARGDSDAAGEDGSPGDSVQLRVVQGVLNLRAAYLCHLPEFDLENADAGFEQATELALSAADAGLEFGMVTSYVSVPSMTAGAITVHRLPSPAAGYVDAGLGEAGLPDAGGADAGADARMPAPPRCDRASLEALLPLPMPQAWVDPVRSEMDAAVPAEAGVRPADAGASLDAGPAMGARGFVSTASGDAPLTLFGSGLLIERTELELRVDAEKESYGREHPSEGQDAALEAADRYRRGLEATIGPRFLLSRPEPALRDRSFSLHFSHLIPDVPGHVDAGSGALRLCVTVGTMEGSELGDAGATAFAFRTYALLGDDLDPTKAYRFRVFVQSAFAAEQKTCATTSLKPVAELTVDAEFFKRGRSYTLVAWGAQTPEAICTSMRGSLIRPGCAEGEGDGGLSTRLKLIQN